MFKRKLLGKYGSILADISLWSLGIIFLCAALLKLTDSLLYNNEKVATSFWDAVYFSIVSFTTLGYGDFHAIGFMRFVVSIESFVGVILMALFALIIAKKVISD